MLSCPPWVWCSGVRLFSLSWGSEVPWWVTGNTTKLSLLPAELPWNVPATAAGVNN